MAVEMTDIVERLRGVISPLFEGVDWTLFDDAADEIERLRAERKNCPPASESEYVRRIENDLKLAEAEIERLRTECADWRKRAFAAMPSAE